MASVFTGQGFTIGWVMFDSTPGSYWRIVVFAIPKWRRHDPWSIGKRTWFGHHIFFKGKPRKNHEFVLGHFAKDWIPTGRRKMGVVCHWGTCGSMGSGWTWGSRPMIPWDILGYFDPCLWDIYGSKHGKDNNDIYGIQDNHILLLIRMIWGRRVQGLLGSLLLTDGHRSPINQQ